MSALSAGLQFWPSLFAAGCLIALGGLVAVRWMWDVFGVRKRGSPAQESDMAEPIELLRIVLDPATQQLQLYLKGRPARPEEIADPHVRMQVVALLRLLQPAPSSPPPAAPLAAPGPAEPAPAPAPPHAAPEPGDELRTPFLARLRDSLKPPVYNAPSISAAKPPPKDSEPAAAANMFAQINDILQRMLRQEAYSTPLEIVGESGELHIRYGERVYLQVDAVPDERARALIHAAVNEWESS